MPFLLHVLTTIAIALPGILGFNLVFGRAKILHFGPVAIPLVTGYVSALTLQSTGHQGTAIIAGLLAALLLSLLFAILSTRLDPDAFGILTLALHLIILTVILNGGAVTRGALGIPNIPRFPMFQDNAAFAAGAWLIAGSWMMLLSHLDQGHFGRALRCLAEQQWYAGSIGLRKASLHTTAFLLSGLGGAITGLLAPQYLHLLHPSDFTFPALIFLVMVVIAGKPGSILGVTLSTVLLTCLKEGMRFLPLPITFLGPLRLLFFGLILLLAIAKRKKTLFPPIRRV